MGLDLRLLPFEGSKEVPYSHSILSCGRDERVFEQIQNIQKNSGLLVPDDFKTFVSTSDDTEAHYGETLGTPYGEDLFYVTVHELVTEVKLPEDTHFRTKAVWAYLKELPPDTKVALFWH
jgi:hypothetical protein